MRVLISDKRNNAIEVREISAIDIVRDVEAYSHYSGECIRDWQFTSVIMFRDTGNDYYIILDSIEEANSLLRKAFMDGIVNLSMYEDRTFVNPDETDIDAIDALHKSIIM